MKIQLIAIGNELLNGKTQDQNANWLAQQCFERHIQLQKVHIIGDDVETFNSSLKQALIEADAVITTGGLGPTKDDLTKTMLVDYFGLKCVSNPRAEKIALEHFRRGQRDYDYQKYDYHLVPQEFEVFHNPTGYAPGLGFVTKEGKVVLAAPGVPNEYKAMLTDSMFNFLSEKLGPSNRHFRNVVVKTWKLAEATILNEMCPTLWDELAKYGTVSSLPHMLGVDIGVFIEGNSEAEVDQTQQKVLDAINATAIKEYIWHIGTKTLEEVIIQLAEKKKVSFAFAESATGGQCSHRISNMKGASQVLKGGVVCYQIPIKTNVLEVKAETIQQHSVYSDQVAIEMAQGVVKVLEADIGVSITGVAGPGDDDGHPAGKVSIGISYQGQTQAQTYYFKGDREGLKFRFSQMALFTLLDKLTNCPT